MCQLCINLGKNVHQTWGVAPETPPNYQYAVRLVEAEKQGMTLKDYMKGKPRWGSIHGHTEYSLLDGGAKIEDILNKAKAMGQDFVATTDHGNMFGVVKAHKYAQKIGVKHIVGCELYLSPVGRSRFDQDFAKGERPYTHLVALAMNEVGYRNLSHLSSIGYLEGAYRQPRIDREVLEQYSEGLIVTTSCIGGSISQLALEGNLGGAEADFNWFMRVFGDRFYVEYQHHNIDIEKRGFEYGMILAQKYGVPVIATTDSHYLDQQDNITHDALLCIGVGDWVDNPNRRFQFEGTGYWYMAEEEVRNLFSGFEEAIENTGKLADRIDDQVIPFGGVALPHFEIPEDQSFKKFTQTNGGGGMNLWQGLLSTN